MEQLVKLCLEVNVPPDALHLACNMRRRCEAHTKMTSMRLNIVLCNLAQKFLHDECPISFKGVWPNVVLYVTDEMKVLHDLHFHLHERTRYEKAQEVAHETGGGDGWQVRLRESEVSEADDEKAVRTAFAAPVSIATVTPERKDPNLTSPPPVKRQR